MLPAACSASLACRSASLVAPRAAGTLAAARCNSGSSNRRVWIAAAETPCTPAASGDRLGREALLDREQGVVPGARQVLGQREPEVGPQAQGERRALTRQGQ